MSAAGRPVRVLVADDSELFREMVSGLLEADPAFEVVAVARDGDEAAALAKRHRPDVITMDLAMPGSDGFAGIARVMADSPTPILVVSVSREEDVSFRALSLGALDLLEKPVAAADLGLYGETLRSRLRLLAGVRVIRHPRGVRKMVRGGASRTGPRPEVVVVGASLGGPRALAHLLQGLAQGFPVPIAVVQHIAYGFAEGLARWLSDESGLDVRTAGDRDPLRPGQVLVAPSGRHLLVERGRVRLDDAEAVDGFKPSVNPLFLSAAASHGPRACGVLLTGMGSDGAAGLKALREAGATTLAQDEATSAVFGMARAALELGAVDRVLPLEEIAGTLSELAR